MTLTTTLLFGSANAFGDVAVGDSGNSHESIWRVTDVGLYMDKSFLELPGAGDAVFAAIDIWRAGYASLPHVWPIVGDVDALGYRAGQDNRNTIRYAAQGEPLAKGALAITLVAYDSATLTILDGDIVVNGIYQFDDNGQYSGQRGADGEHSAYDIGDVLAHEFGHWFGLPDDPADPTAIMYPYFDPGETRRKSLSDGDKQALIDLYASNTTDDHKPATCSVGVIPSRSRPAIYIWAGIGLIGVSQLLRRRHVTAAVKSGQLPMARGPLDPNDLGI